MMERRFSKFVGDQSINQAKVVKVIRTVHNRGLGTEENVVRNVTTYWTLEGEMICELDPVPPKGKDDA